MLVPRKAVLLLLIAAYVFFEVVFTCSQHWWGLTNTAETVTVVKPDRSTEDMLRIRVHELEELLTDAREQVRTSRCDDRGGGTAAAKTADADRSHHTGEASRYTELVNRSSILGRDGKFAVPDGDSVMRRSRTIVGNTERLHTFVRKLLAGQCTSLLFVGGSVSHGKRNEKTVELVDITYYTEFTKYLNEAYPCSGGAGQHTFKAHAPGGTDSAYAWHNWQNLFRGTNGHVDLLSFE